jgi:hypothetical protein
MSDIAVAPPQGVTVDLAELRDRRCRRIFPPRARLFLYLRAATENGRAPVRFTNAAADELGLPRDRKTVALRQLERAGVVKVDRTRLLTPLVWLVSPVR